MDVDGRCDGERDEYQRSESGNKPLRQSEGRCVARVRQSVATNSYTFRDERSDELGGMAVNFLIFNR